MHKIFLLSFLFLFQVPTPAVAATLHDAAKTGDTVAIAAALDAGSDPNKIVDGATPLYLAVRRGHLAAANLLIERGADVNEMTKSGPALIAAAEKGRQEFIELLLQNGADPNLGTRDHVALHLVIRRGCFPCVKALVEADANVNVPAFDGKTPLHLAKLLSYGEIADYLIEHGVLFPEAASISNRLSTADPKTGRRIFQSHCSRCHTVEAGGVISSAPNLWEVVGRKRASTDFGNHSEALRSWPGVWTTDDLNTFLAAPMAVVPGTFMDFPGIRDEFERLNLVAYLATLRGK
jgi:cytochrome c